jgi:hypothetical protein
MLNFILNGPNQFSIYNKSKKKYIYLIKFFSIRMADKFIFLFYKYIYTCKLDFNTKNMTYI